MKAGADRVPFSSRRSVGRQQGIEDRKRPAFAESSPLDVRAMQAAAEAPQRWMAALSGSGPGTRGRGVGSLQRAAGNTQVQRLIRVPEPGVQRQTEEDEEEEVQRAPEGGGGSSDGSLASRIGKASRSGSNLDDSVRARLEEGLGADLTGVRVHTDAEADQLAQEMESVAFTSGSDIFFRSGEFNPSSQDGVRLLAHEAAHTIQQARGPVTGTPVEGGVSVSDPGDSFELAAKQAAERVAGGEAAYQAAQVPADLKKDKVPVQRDNYHGDYFDDPTVDAASSLAWDFAGGIPLVGNIVNFAGLGIDLGKAGIDYAFGDEETGAKHLRAAGADALGMVPGVNVVSEWGNLATDAAAVGGRLGGGSPEQFPTSGDIWDKLLSSWGSAGGPGHESNEGAEGAGPVYYPEEGGGGAGGAGGAGAGGAGGAPGYYEEQY